MIGYLSGTAQVSPQSFLVVCHGVGYSVHVTGTVHKTTVSGQTLALFVYSHIREDAFDLYGFLTEQEKLLFLRLIDVNGVGPKTALSILDKGVSAIIQAIQSADVSFFSSVPRVGKKSAQKIIIELKSALVSNQELDLVEPSGVAKEVFEALISLGFSESEGQRAVKELELEHMRVEDAVKAAIKRLTTHS